MFKETSSFHGLEAKLRSLKTPENRPECTDYCPLARKQGRKTPLSTRTHSSANGIYSSPCLGLSPTRTSPCLNKNIKVGRERERRWPWIRPGASGGAGWPPEFSSLLCWLSKTSAELVVSGAGGGGCCVSTSRSGLAKVDSAKWQVDITKVLHVGGSLSTRLFRVAYAQVLLVFLKRSRLGF